MPLVLLVLFLVMPLVELYVIMRVGDQLGLLPTIGLLIAASVLGAWLVKREGARAWAAFHRALAEGRVPARETADGALVIFGGALLLTPGFVTDIVGLLCVLPPTRALVRGLLIGFVTAGFAPLRWYDAGRTGVDRARRVQRFARRRRDRKQRKAERRAARVSGGARAARPAPDRRPANVRPPDHDETGRSHPGG